MIDRQNRLDNAKCYETIRWLRWPVGVCCSHYESAGATKQGRDSTQPARQKDRCESGHHPFDDLAGTVLAGHQQPLRVWILCLYFMELNLSNT